MRTEKKDTKKVKNPVPQESEPGVWQAVKSFLKSDILHFIIGLALALFSAFAILAFVQYFFNGAADQSAIENISADQLSSGEEEVQNATGIRGAQMAEFFISYFGVPTLLIALFFLVAGLKMMRVVKVRLWKWFIGCSLLTIWLSVFLGFMFKSFYQDSFFYFGGIHGYNVSEWLEQQVGVPGLLMILFFTAVCLLVYFSTQTVIWIRKAFSLSYLKRKKKEQPEDDTDVTDNPQEGKEQDGEKTEEEDTAFEDPKANVIDLGEPDDTFKVVTPEDGDLMEGKDKDTDDGDNEDDDEELDPKFQVEVPKDEEVVELEPYNPRLDLSHYKFPTLDLMKHFDNDGPSVDMDEQQENKKRIEDVLHSFGIDIRTITATVGPTITLYEITLVEGIRIAKIRNLEDDIALQLKALGIRIIAPIPGKGTIGIEVPNNKPRIVSGQSVIGSKAFQESKADLPMVLGKTISNEPFVIDLAKMPHLLVAGATGQGKSVGLNAMITSLLYKKHPAELKLVLVDPKKLEFGIYSELEYHFLAELPDATEPVVTDVKKVVRTLNSLCVEMDARYELMKDAHVRTIKEYNEKFINRVLNPNKGHRFLPYIVVVIDEFGDLIMTAGREVELPIARIAQLARACGIHMIIATQRPTTNIITGNIKANFPARVAFRVTSMIDSRTILDRPGANQLIGKGDMLFLSGNDPVRMQCAFIDTPEVDNIVKFIAKQQSYTVPFYLPEVAEDSDAEGGGAEVDMDKLDSLFEDAARLLVIHQNGSTSLIQRKFSIGYNRAGRLMDQLEKAGIVGPAQGSKPRDVLCADEMALEDKLMAIRG
ncbi:MAG: DNA translocase FtsK [Bacteroidaceae bacterium]|nr:DNA translocase FtsK [Bacteroidaceae bacterium]